MALSGGWGGAPDGVRLLKYIKNENHLQAVLEFGWEIKFFP